jgi:hypothetical protein
MSGRRDGSGQTGRAAASNITDFPSRWQGDAAVFPLFFRRSKNGRLRHLDRDPDLLTVKSISAGYLDSNIGNSITRRLCRP